jgi:hypothetical protein
MAAAPSGFGCAASSVKSEAAFSGTLLHTRMIRTCGTEAAWRAGQHSWRMGGAAEGLRVRGELKELQA